MNLEEVCGKCTVVCSEDLTISVDEYSRSGRDKFYFREAYNPGSKEFEDVPDKARQQTTKGKVRVKLPAVNLCDVPGICQHDRILHILC